MVSDELQDNTLDSILEHMKKYMMEMLLPAIVHELSRTNYMRSDVRVISVYGHMASSVG